MFADLPKTLQDEVKHYLMMQDFRKAKKLHDAWLKQHNDQATA